jgi:hypothetical protein
MKNNNYDWIKPGVRAWVAGLVCPVEVEVFSVHIFKRWVSVQCGILFTIINPSRIYQIEAECLEAMKKEL